MDQAGNNRPVAADGAADEPDTTHIRAQIAQTRAEMTDTLGALQDRLRPEHLAHQAGDAVRDAVESRVKSVASGASDVGRRVAAQTRTSARELQAQAQDHPALAGAVLAALIGVAGAVVRRRQRGARVLPPLVPAVLTGAAGYYAVSQVARRRPEAAARVTRAAGALGHDVAAAGQRAAQGATAAGKRAAHGAADAGQRAVHGATEASKRAVQDASAASQRAVQQARQWADEHSLVLAGVAVLAGVVVGASLPVVTVPPSGWQPRAPR